MLLSIQLHVAKSLKSAVKKLFIIKVAGFRAPPILLKFDVVFNVLI